jgi:hypothetical protein
MISFKIFYEQTFNGLAKGKSVEDLAKKHNISVDHINSQLKKGIKIEHEHTKDNNTAKKIAMDHLFEDPDYYTKLAKVVESTQQAINALQAALDIIGFEPTVGTFADGANVIISGLRAGLSKTTDERKKHIINAGISAISLIPFADIIKVLKLRKAKPIARAAVAGARQIKKFGKTTQASNRFSNQPELSGVTEGKTIHDPVRPGILKRQIKGKVTCAKARALHAKQKNKNNATAKAARRFQNYHC